MPAPSAARLRHPLTVLRRPDGSLQVGLDAAASVILPSAPPGADAALRALRTWSDPAEVTASAGIPLQWLAEALGVLRAAGLLAPPPRPRPLVPVVGTGPIARQIVRLLAGSGRASPLASPTPPQAAPDALVVVCPATIEPDRVLMAELVRTGRPHLVVRCEPERAVVGPLVEPGRGPCTRCTDLTRRDLDPAWPYLLAQLCRMECTPSPEQEAWAAATATTQVLCWLAEGEPETRGATLELDAAGATLAARAWASRPECGCAQAR